MKKTHIKSLSVILVAILIIKIFSTVCYASPKKLRVNAGSAIAVDSLSGRVLFEQNSRSLVPVASTTKIVTALVALSYGDLEEEFTISKNSAAIRGSTVGYKAGEKITLYELLYGLMFKSGNDAAIAIAEGIGGSVEGFCSIMNEYCIQIGMLDSHFESPHGLDSQNHYSTAYDLAIATKKAKENPIFHEIVSSKSIDKSKHGFTRDYQNINKLLYQMPNANGVKTGYTGGAGKCLVSSVNMGEGDIIMVTLNCTPRWEETKKIFNYVDEVYDYKKVISKGEVLKNIEIENGDGKLNLISRKDVILPVKEDEKLNIEVDVPENLKAPISKEEKIGTVRVSDENGKIVYEYMLSQNEIEKKPIYKIIKEKLLN
ncbi:D-alanyl-D-alanine carboxypeptidase family protein [Clostridium senegalense]|uniref:serine-type D-Ala-D-Ala carboxypeptidase n=1 Tax=Clostridium senegalense TaxID=1465809 RepID=A0A6M0H0A5_9CLOT|nr:D-alanyl-D-alanine carboxypeptidase family protein [Clostridium senegalense]NEU03608.1 D-alanyl-D-alanine carboxypeptidase [Clostridium senegalense]